MKSSVWLIAAMLALTAEACATRGDVPRPPPEPVEANSPSPVEPQPISSTTFLIVSAPPQIQSFSPTPRHCPAAVQRSCPTLICPAPPILPAPAIANTCGPAIVQSFERGETVTAKWSDFQSLIQLGIALCLLFGLFETVIKPTLDRALQKRDSVVKSVKARTIKDHDSVALARADDRLAEVRQYEEFSETTGYILSLAFGLLSIGLLAFASHRAQADPGWDGVVAIYVISIAWPSLNLLYLTFLLVSCWLIVRRLDKECR